MAVPVVAPAAVAETPVVKSRKSTKVSDTLAASAAPAKAAPPRPSVDLPPEEDEPDEEGGPTHEIEFPTPPHIAESVREMLKTEAEREADARADEPGGDSWGKRRSSPLREKMNKARATDGPMPEDAAMANAVAGLAPVVSAGVAGPAPTGSRRDVLPDVEEINSSLQAQDRFGEGMADHPQDDRARSSARAAFFLVIFLALLAMAIYALSDMIADQVPQLAGPMKTYVDWVDGLRGLIDEQVKKWSSG